MPFQVVVTPSAKADIFEINARLLENFPDAADWLWGISQAVTSLSKFPERCPVSPESEAFDVVVVRQLLYGRKPNVYRILFSVREEKVYVLRVRSTRQQSLLDE